MKYVIKRPIPEKENKIFTDETSVNKTHICFFSNNQYILSREENLGGWRWVRLNHRGLLLSVKFTNMQSSIDYMLDLGSSVYEVEDFEEAMKVFRGEIKVNFY